MKTKKTPELAYTCRRDAAGDYVARIPAIGALWHAKTRAEALSELADIEAEYRDLFREEGRAWPTYASSLAAIKRGGARQRCGRKPLDAPRNASFQVSVAKADITMFRAAARAKGQTLSTWAYTKLCAAARRAPALAAR